MPQRNSTFLNLNSRPFTLLYILLCFGAIAGAQLGMSLGAEWRWLHYLTKPVATALLMLAVLSLPEPFSVHYRNAIASGLAFAIGGDFFLMLPGDYFIAGLVCFLLTHCAYIYALLFEQVTVKPLIFIIFALIAGAIFAGLWQALPAGLHIAVALYAAALALMAALAVNRACVITNAETRIKQAAQIAALGGILFVISDTILAYGRFRFNIPLNPLWVLGTYYAAQWCFARSVIRMDHD